MSGNIIPLPQVHPLVKRHSTTPQQMHVMLRELVLWMYDHGVEQVHVAREPGTAKIKLTVDGAPT